MLNAELGRFHYTAMPFGSTVAGDVSQHKLDECFGKIEQVIIIADDIMIVGYKPHHSDHEQAFTTLLQTAKQCNVNVKLQYKENEVEFLVRPAQQVAASQAKIKYKQSHLCHYQPTRSKYNPLFA